MSWQRSGASLGRLALLPLLAATAILATRTAAADAFRYVDRSGHAHALDVSSRQSADAPPVLEETSPIPLEAVDKQGASGEIPYLAYVKRACATHMVPLPLALAVMKVESGFNPRAISDKGALGLMQLMPATAADLGVLDPFDPQQNIDGGVRYLHTLMDGFPGDFERVLAAYHAGAARVRRAGGAPFETTRRYVQMVMRLYRSYSGPALGARPPR